MKAIAIRSFISEQDKGCSEHSKLKIQACKVYSIRPKPCNEYYIETIKTEIRTQNLSNYTFLTAEEFEENFKVIEE
jgi:hypothetical protein